MANVETKQNLNINTYLVRFSSCSCIMSTLSSSPLFPPFLFIYWWIFWSTSISTWMQHLLYEMCVLRGVWSEIRSLLPPKQNPRCCHCHVSLKKGQHCYCKWYFTQSKWGLGDEMLNCVHYRGVVGIFLLQQQKIKFYLNMYI